jgi:hypothetical protein
MEKQATKDVLRKDQQGAAEQIGFYCKYKKACGWI